MISLRRNPSRTLAFGAAALCLIAGLGMSVEFRRGGGDVTLWQIGLCILATAVFVLVGLYYKTKSRSNTRVTR